MPFKHVAENPTCAQGVRFNFARRATAQNHRRYGSGGWQSICSFLDNQEWLTRQRTMEKLPPRGLGARLNFEEEEKLDRWHEKRKACMVTVHVRKEDEEVDPEVSELFRERGARRGTEAFTRRALPLPCNAAGSQRSRVVAPPSERPRARMGRPSRVQRESTLRTDGAPMRLGALFCTGTLRGVRSIRETMSHTDRAKLLAPTPVSMNEIQGRQASTASPHPPHDKAWPAQHTTHPTTPTYLPPSEGRSAERAVHEGTGQRARQLRPARYSPSSALSRTEQKPGQLDASAATPTVSSDPRLPHARTPTDKTRSSARPPSSSAATSEARPQPAPSVTQHAWRVSSAPEAPAVQYAATHRSAPGELSRTHEPEARHTSAGHPLAEAHARKRSAVSSAEPPAGRQPHVRIADAGGERAASPRGARAQRESPAPKKSPVACTNNKHDPRLRENGGSHALGTRSQCIRRGFGSGLYSKPENVEEFIRKHSVPYEKLVQQNLWFKDSTENMPANYQVATLPQAFQRGFGAGQAKLARQLLEERRSKTHGSAPT